MSATREGNTVLDVVAALSENPLVSLPDILVGVNKAKQIQGANGTASGGEIFTTYTFRLSMLHSCFDDGDFIVWSVQGFSQPLRQRRTESTLHAFSRFRDSIPMLFEACGGSAITLHPDPAAVASGR